MLPVANEKAKGQDHGVACDTVEQDCTHHFQGGTPGTHLCYLGVSRSQQITRCGGMALKTHTYIRLSQFRLSIAAMATAIMRTARCHLLNVIRVLGDQYALSLDHGEVSTTGNVDLPSQHSKQAQNTFLLELSRYERSYLRETNGRKGHQCEHSNALVQWRASAGLKQKRPD